MTEIKSLSAPAIGEAGVLRLFAFCKPKSMKEGDTLFTAGYEQAKRDFYEKLRAEVGTPREKTEPTISPVIPKDEARARKSAEAKRGWWR